MRTQRWIVCLAAVCLLPLLTGCEDQETTRKAEALERTLRSQVESERAVRIEAEKQLVREQRQRRIERIASEQSQRTESRKIAFGEVLSLVFGCLAGLAIFLLARERRLRRVLGRVIQRCLGRRAKNDE
jgi:hypothetical protein